MTFDHINNNSVSNRKEKKIYFKQTNLQQQQNLTLEIVYALSC